MESLSILTAFLFLNGTKKFNILYAILVFSAITGLIIGSVFIWKNFPVCFVEGEGLTVFKKGSEYVINLILAICIWLLNRNRHYFSKNVYKWLLYSLICTIIAEFAFTFYISNYGFSNLIGHYFKIFSFYFIYKALVSTGIEEPYSVIFRELSQKEKALKESNAAKDKLFSVIMHDIRGPLGGLMLFTREVNKNFDSYGPEIIQDLLQKAEQSIASLYEMMETLFIWAKSNSVKIQPKYTSAPLLKLVNLSVEPLLKMIEDKGIVMDVCISDELILICDEEITKTVVRNIVSNAVKFSPNGGLIEIKGIEDSGNVYMTVRNEGEGIPHQKLMRIFELDSDKSTVGTAGEKGTGIGLVLCRDLMSLQGGVIRIFSTEGIGVEVKLIFARNYI
jgi:signal transduction histidine kinase